MKRTVVLVVLILLILSLCACGTDAVVTPNQHVHQYGSWEITTPATCNAEGQKTQKCSCGDAKHESVAKLEHTYTETVSLEQSCEHAGIVTFTCSACQNSYTEERPMETYDSTSLYELYKDRVCQITIYDKKGQELALGSGFIYSEDGRIITNYHVIEGAASAKVALSDKEYTVEKVLAYDKNIDVVVLQIDATGLTPAVLCKRDHAVGATVYALGSSQGLTSTFSDGMITYAKREQDGVDYVQHDAPISSGNSGGPLINSYGEVIGINTWTVRDSQNLNFAIHLSELDNLVYSTPLTMAEYYEKECDAYTMLANYIMETGEYDAEDKDYSLLLLDTYQDSNEYLCIAYYDTVDDEIYLMTMVFGDTDFWTSVDLDREISGRYFWMCGSDDYYSAGNLTASYFSQSSTLTREGTNASASIANALDSLAPALIYLSLVSLETEMDSLGLTLEDFGFLLI